MCAVPWIEAFSNANGGWRNCCSASPQIKSLPGESFVDWWHSPDLQNFRQQFGGETLPIACTGCSMQEQVHGHSFRTAVNKTVNLDQLKIEWPSRWNVIFGNTCNLACWTCNEYNSSVIEYHKNKLNLLQSDFTSPDQNFADNWQQLQSDILQSYNHHSLVTLTILGGEPLFNNQVLEFLNYLVEKKLSLQTRLEFHTNGTKFDQKIQKILTNSNWDYICIFISLDAVGRKAEWLRYGSNWSQIEQNIPKIYSSANYVEAHCTLSILNIIDLEELQDYCDKNRLPLKIHLLSNPDFMDLRSWDLNKDLFLKMVNIDHPVFSNYYTLIGCQPKSGSHARLLNYITQFNKLRQPLEDFNKKLHDLIMVSTH